MPPTGIEKWLANAEAKWGEERTRAAESKGDYERHPDGRYVTRLTTAEVCESQSSNRPQVKWGYTIIEGELKGELLWSYDGLDNDESLFYLAKRLGRFGFDPAKIKLRFLQKTLDKLIEQHPVCVVRARTKGEYQNILLDRIIEDYEEDDEDLDEDDDDVEEDEEEEAELEVGMEVEFEKGGKTLTGKVRSIDEDAGKAKVKVGPKLITVSIEDVVIVEPEEEDEDE